MASEKAGDKTGFGSLEGQKGPVGVQMQLVRVEVTDRRWTGKKKLHHGGSGGP